MQCSVTYCFTFLWKRFHTNTRYNQNYVRMQSKCSSPTPNSIGHRVLLTCQTSSRSDWLGFSPHVSMKCAVAATLHAHFILYFFVFTAISLQLLTFIFTSNDLLNAIHGFWDYDCYNSTCWVTFSSNYTETDFPDLHWTFHSWEICCRQLLLRDLFEMLVFKTARGCLWFHLEFRLFKSLSDQ